MIKRGVHKFEVLERLKDRSATSGSLVWRVFENSLQFFANRDATVLDKILSVILYYNYAVVTLKVKFYLVVLV